MIARKRLNHSDSKELTSVIESTLTSGYSSTFSKQHGKLQLSKQNGRSNIRKASHDCSNPIGEEGCAQSVGARSSCFQDHRSSQTIASWVMANNITRLKTAYRYLTPIIDDIISRATSYTHREFKEILVKRQPICSISYTQYIRAYQASEIISQVGKELGSVNGNMPYKVDFAVNNVATIKREDLLENIERMADRIFIDRDLMKQLVNLHELITETIKKLKTSLEQVSIEGIPQDAQDAQIISGSLEQNAEDEVEIDRDAIRKQIAENFIVIGEPKTKGCHCNDGPQGGFRPFIDSPNNRSFINQNSIVMEAQIDESSQPLQQNKQRKCSVPRRTKKEKIKMKNVSTCRSSSSKRKDKNCSILQSLKDSEENEYFSKKIVTRTGEHSIDRNSAKLSVELHDLANRSTPYTVGLREYELKCNEGVTKACAIVPENTHDLHENTQEQNLNPYFDIDEDPLIVADSDSNESQISPETSGTPMRQTLDKEVLVLNDCLENCNTENGVPCSDVLTFLRGMMAKIADQLLYLKESDIIDFEEKEFIDCDIPSLDREHYTMQEVMYCLEALESVKNKLVRMNFMEVDANFPDERVGCCYRVYPHVHTDLIGIPIVVKISQTLLDLLSSGYPFAASTKQHLPEPVRPISVEHKETNALIKPATENKRCECKPATLKSLFKEKCALAKMIHSRNETSNKNKVVMMTVDPMFDNIFGMRANSLIVESAFEQSEPDIFQVMDMADSNTSLPYVVNRSSLPNVAICPAMDIPIPTLRHQVRNIVVEHPKPRVEHELQEIGLDNLLKASLPAKCCQPNALNRTDAEEEPFHASLNSLPLTTSDLQMIADVAEEANYNDALCKYHPINYYFTASIQFKFERYTNFQEQYTSKYNFFVPKCRVYLVYYFEIFKKEAEQDENFYDSSERQRTSHHGRNNRRRQQHQYDTRYPTSETNYEHHPPRSLISEFFKRFMSSMPNEPTNYYEKHTYMHQQENNKKPRKKNSKHRKSDGEKNSKKDYKKPRHPKTLKHLKNQRLQTSTPYLEYYLEQEPFPEMQEMPEDIEDNQGYSFELNKISSSMKNYTVSQLTSPKSKVSNLKTKDSRSSTARDKSNSSRNSKSNLIITKKKSIAPKNVSSKLENRTMEESTFPEACKCNCMLSPTSSKEALGFELELSDPARPKSHRKEQKFDKIKINKELSASSHNLGTIYESEEKLLNKESFDCSSPQSSFFDFLRTSELSKSFQRFVESEEAIDIFEKNEIEPEEFWSRYFKLRRDAHRPPAKSCSVTSTAGDTETSRMEDVPMLLAIDNDTIPKPLKLRSRIPQRIRTNFSDTSSDISINRFSVTPQINRRESSYATSMASVSPHTSKMQCARSHLSVISRMHSTAQMNKNRRNDTNIYYAEILNQSEKNPATEVSSMHSLRVLANKNGPGYITILHPACGCPEVSVFIPCYCNEKGQKRAGMTTKHISRLSANTNGRHILLPSSCRIPRLVNDSAKDRTAFKNIRITSRI